ncbi:phosphatase PAP2 family protein [Streptomyces jietaisiensis]
MDESRPWPSRLRPGRALAHTPGAPGSGSPHRSDGRSSHTPRDGRHTGPDGRPGTSPPCSGPASLLPPSPAPSRARFLALLAVPVALLTLLTWQVLADGPLLRVDARLSRALVRPGRPAELLSDLGNVQVAVPVLALCAGWAAWRYRATGTDRWWGPPGAALLLIALVPAVVVPLKNWTARPGTPAVPPGTGYYPSGHTATALVAYGAAALLLLTLLTARWARAAVLTGWLALTLGVSFGLVRRGYHWPVDVVASWCLGAVLLMVFARVVRRLRRPEGGTSR